MTTARETIITGLQALKVLGFGQSPTSAQGEYCLRQLNAYIRQLVGYSGSLPLQNVRVSSAYQVCNRWPALRLHCMSGVTITLPEHPAADGMRIEVVDTAGTAATSNITIARNGWNIAGAAADATISTNGASRLYMFRADIGDWKLAGDLGLDDPIPFPADFDEAIALIAARRYSLFGQRLSPDDDRLADAGAKRLRARYAKPPAAQFEAAVSGIGGRTPGSVGGSLNDFLNGVD